MNIASSLHVLMEMPRWLRLFAADEEGDCLEFADKLYIGPSIRNRKDRIVSRVKQGKMILSLYCITKAKNSIDLYDIYNYHELRQSYYQKHPVTVIGLAGSKEEAIGIVAHMIQKLI